MLKLLNKFINRIKKSGYQVKNNPHFPSRQLGLIKQKRLENLLYRQIKKESRQFELNYSSSPIINQKIISLNKKIAKFNPNNIGNWSTDTNPNSLSTKLEKETITQIINLFGGESNNFEGYISSGGSEANIFACWLGKEYLKKRTKKQVIFTTDLSHYSIKKAARVTSTKIETLQLDEEQWHLSLENLEAEVRLLSQQGIKGFMLPMTIGDSLVGVSDPYHEVIKLTSQLENELGVTFFVWLDAAYLGLILPFIKTDFLPLKSPAIRLLIVDYHKYPAVPYPAGTIIYQKELRSLVESEKIDYLDHKDSTLLGSRPGVSAILIWYLNQILGKEGFKKQIEVNLKKKRQFISQIKHDFPQVKIINSPNNLQVALIVEDKRVRKKIQQDYRLKVIKTKLNFTSGQQEVNLFRAFF